MGEELITIQGSSLRLRIALLLCSGQHRNDNLDRNSLSEEIYRGSCKEYALGHPSLHIWRVLVIGGRTRMSFGV